jgi:hypothetical protein
MLSWQDAAGNDLARTFATASHAARSRHDTSSPSETAIRDVAAGVAGPALVGYVLWILGQAHALGLKRLRFLSRDGQILYLIAKSLAERTGNTIDLEYVYSSRITWSLAASNPRRLSASDWLFSSFMKSNAADLCDRLGIRLEDFHDELVESGVSLDPKVRANRPDQRAALERFVDRDDVAAAVAPRVATARGLLLDYSAQHSLADASTGLVDSGWTGRMVGSLVHVTEESGYPRPNIFFWGHEPRPDGWTDPDRLHAFIYNTARREGLQWRVPDAPFIVETFCMGDHGIFGGYRRNADGHISAVLRSSHNAEAEEWGLDLYRSTLIAFAEETDPHTTGDARPLIHQLMNSFWVKPTRAEAKAWGSYPYDSDPTGAAARALGRSFTAGEILAGLRRGKIDRGDRAWLRGSLKLTNRVVRSIATRHIRRDDLLGEAPAAEQNPSA